MKRAATSHITGRRERTEDREDAEHQQVELVDRLAAEAVAEFALADAVPRNMPNTVALPIARGFGPRSRIWIGSCPGSSAPQTVKSMTSKKYPAAMSAITLTMQRRYFCIVQRVADESLNCLSHGEFPLSRL